MTTASTFIRQLTPAELAELEARTDAGIELLNREIPGWENTINEDNLDLKSCSACVLGQAFGPDAENRHITALLYDMGYGHGRDDGYNLGLKCLKIPYSESEKLGFNMDVTDFALISREDEMDEDMCIDDEIVETFWGALTGLWQRKIAAIKEGLG